MNLTQLRAFHVVAQERSFTKAAGAAHVSQPTLSGQVKALEETYRVRLFERRGRGVQLTELGQNLHALTQRLFTIEGEAQALLWRDYRIATEPGGAAALAALISGAYKPSSNERIGVLLCGANVELSKLAELMHP